MTFVVQKTYNFETLAPAILGATFRNAVMLGEISYEVAVTRENIDLKYRQIYPVLPPNTTDNPKIQRYFILRTEIGQMVTLCEQWINMASIQEVQGVSFSVHFQNANPEDQQRVRQILVAAGFTGFSIK